MTSVEQRLLDSLLELERAVRTIPGSGAKPTLLPLFRQLDDLTAQLPPGTSPDLLHYLHKKSYEKARLWLQGRDAENQAGHCGHVP